MPPLERLKQANRDVVVWSAQGNARWARPGQAVEEHRFLWRESSGAWAVAWQANDAAPAPARAEGGKNIRSRATETGPEGGATAPAEQSLLAGAMASEHGVFLVHANGQADPVPERIMTERIQALWGPLPVEQLRAWILALPSSPGDVFTYYPNGLPSGLTPKEAHGWTVVYRGWLDSTPALPQNILLKGPDGTEVEIRLDFVSLRQPLPAPPGLSF